MDAKGIPQGGGMGLHLLSVTNVGTGCRRPGLSIFAKWLPGIGFVPGALVQALPGPGGGMVFKLCDENIRRYSELDAATKDKGGKLMQAYLHNSARHGEIPALAVSGQALYDAGFSIGDALAAVYEYGLIRLRKRPDTLQATSLKAIKNHKTGEPVLKLRLAGMWLPGLGFVRDALLTADIKSGCITFELRDNGIEKYSGLVRYARQNKLRLLQVKTIAARGKLFPYIMLTGACLEGAGFKAGEPLLALCGYGFIKLQKLDFVDMGF